MSLKYTTRSKVEQYLKADLSAVSSEVENWIIAASSIIDAYVGYSFTSASSDKYYDYPKREILFTDRFTGSPTVTIYNYDGSVFKTLTEGIGKDYVIQPYNDGYADRIVFLSNPYYLDGLLDPDEQQIGERRVKITANWGYGATVPEDVVLACTMIVADIAEKRIKGGTPSSESLGDYSITYKSIEGGGYFAGVKAILDHYLNIII